MLTAMDCHDGGVNRDNCMKIGDGHFYHGDCLEIMPTIPDASVDAIITDPPYGDTSLKWDKRVRGWHELASNMLAPTGSMWVFGSFRYFMDEIEAFRAAGFRVAQEIIWEKHNGSGFSADRFKRVHEIIVQFYHKNSSWSSVWNEPQFTNDATPRSVRRKKRPTHTGHIEQSHYVSEDGGPRLMRSVIYQRSEHGRAIHPTQKPTELMEILLNTSCPGGATVLDPFAGSGTTAIAAMRTGRRWICIEKDPDYHAAAVRRVMLERVCGG